MEPNNERSNEETPAQSFDENENNDNDQSELGDGEDVQGKIFIGGLSWSTTESTLRYYFEKYGELSDVALMLDKKTGKPRGFGFIKMKDPAAADVVLANEHTIDGRLVDVKRALPRDKAPGPARSEACKIFVGGLSLEVTETEFKDHFNKYGVVKEGIIMYDRNSGLSRGFGFITFEKEDSVDAVLKTEHELKGKVVEIKRAEPREPRGGFDNQFNNGQYNGGGGGGGRFSRGGNFGGRGRGDGGGGGGGGGRGGNNFNQQNYGGYMNNMSRYNPYGGGYRAAPYAAAAPIYGYPAAPMNAGMGYYGAMAPGAGGYAGYAGAAVPYPAAAAPDYRAPNADASKGGYDVNQMRPVQQFGYGVGPMPAYAGYVYAPAAQPAPATTNRAQNNSDSGNTGNQSYGSEQGNYGAYKGATQGRADRSYRPY